jgi:small GTP-binding protein
MDGPKVVLVGSSGVGKTSILQRLADDDFHADTTSTVGVQFKVQAIQTGEEVVKLNIWDTAGQERYRSISKAYFRSAIGALLVYAVNEQQTFHDLDGWLQDIHEQANPNAVIFLLGNKCDLVDTRQVTDSQAKDYAERNHLQWFEVSAKESIGIQDTFQRLVLEIKRKSVGDPTQAENPAPAPIEAAPAQQDACPC